MPEVNTSRLLPSLQLAPPANRRIVDGRYRLDQHAVACSADFDRVRDSGDTSTRFLPAMRHICQQHGLATDGLDRYADGFNLVYAVGDDLVIKLYCPYFPEDCDIECASLQALKDLPVAPPRIIARGQLEGWPYLIMTRLGGVELGTLWEALPSIDKQRLIHDVGGAVAAMQAVPVSQDLRPFVVHWPDFVRQQAADAPGRRPTARLDPMWIPQIDPFIAANLHLAEDDATPVFLHSELTDNVWLVEQLDGRWELTGIYDFADAMVGDGTYDLIGPALFLGRGDAGLHRAFLQGAGIDPALVGQSWRRRCLLYLLLHPYSNLAWFLSTAPPPSHVVTLDDLADFWFSV